MTRQEFDNVKVGTALIHKLFTAYHNTEFYGKIIDIKPMQITFKFIDNSIYTTSDITEFELAP
jgi:hypothetical protein